MKSRILVVDDHTLFREALTEILKKQENFEVIDDRCANGEEAISACNTNRPDLILMDVSMPVMDGLEATRIIKEKHPEVQVIMLSMVADEEFIIRSIVSGASGYLLKTIETRNLIDHLHSVLDGEAALDTSVTQTILKAIRSEIDSEKVLGKRETEVLHLASKGKSNKEIASKLYVSTHTVKTHFSRIFEKLGAHTRTEAVALAYKKHII